MIALTERHTGDLECAVVALCKALDDSPRWQNLVPGADKQHTTVRLDHEKSSWSSWVLVPCSGPLSAEPRWEFFFR